MIFQQQLHLQCGFPREQQTSFVVELYLKSALAVAAGWGQLCWEWNKYPIFVWQSRFAVFPTALPFHPLIPVSNHFPSFWFQICPQDSSQNSLGISPSDKSWERNLLQLINCISVRYIWSNSFNHADVTSWNNSWRVSITERKPRLERFIWWEQSAINWLEITQKTDVENTWGNPSKRIQLIILFQLYQNWCYWVLFS